MAEYRFRFEHSLFQRAKIYTSKVNSFDKEASRYCCTEAALPSATSPTNREGKFAAAKAAGRSRTRNEQRLHVLAACH
jgi:hypothetical protein